MKKILLGIIASIMIASSAMGFDLQSILQVARASDGLRKAAVVASVASGLGFAVYKVMIAAKEVERQNNDDRRDRRDDDEQDREQEPDRERQDEDAEGSDIDDGEGYSDRDDREGEEEERKQREEEPKPRKQEPKKDKGGQGKPAAKAAAAAAGGVKPAGMPRATPHDAHVARMQKGRNKTNPNGNKDKVPANPYRAEARRRRDSDVESITSHASVAANRRKAGMPHYLPSAAVTDNHLGVAQVEDRVVFELRNARTGHVPLKGADGKPMWH